ncbi:MAG: putative nucleic acid-binding protein [Haloarculaceae archaeon]|jgi:predicted nucleic acid-binding protein
MNCLDSSFVVDFLDPEQDHHETAVEWMEAHADGTPLGARDTLVATAAAERGYTLVTRDRDFATVPDLDVDHYDETDPQRS